MNASRNRRGFTIVELLIVIVVIAILAAITIVAYNGIQARARNSSAAAASNTLTKKIEVFNSLTGSYPVFNTVGTITSQLATLAESSVSGSGVTIQPVAASINATNGTNTIQVRLCGATAPASGATATGYQIYRWDYTTGALQTTAEDSGGVTTACSTSTSGS